MRLYHWSQSIVWIEESATTVWNVQQVMAHYQSSSIASKVLVRITTFASHFSAYGGFSKMNQNYQKKLNFHSMSLSLGGDRSNESTGWKSRGEKVEESQSVQRFHPVIPHNSGASTAANYLPRLVIVFLSPSLHIA